MPTFKTAHDTVFLQSGFPEDESYRSARGRDTGVQPRHHSHTKFPVLSSTAGGPTGSTWVCKPRPICQSLAGRTGQASERHMTLPFPEPKTRTACEPPTEGSRAPTPPRPSDLHPGSRGSPPDASPRIPRPLGLRPLLLWVVPSPQSPPPEPSTGSGGMAGTGHPTHVLQPAARRRHDPPSRADAPPA